MSRLRSASRSAVAGAAAIVSFLIVAGCGGQSQDVASVLKQTFGPHSPIHSYRLDLTLGIDVKGIRTLPGPIALRLDGPYVNAAPKQLPRFNLDVASNSGGQSFAATATVTADKAFITVAGTPYVLPDQLFQQFRAGYSSASQTPSKSSGTTLGLTPRAWLLSPQRLADVRIGDANTIHIRAGVDVPRLLQDVSGLLGRASSLGVSVPGAPKTITPAQQQAISQAVKNAVVDIYTGSDDRILRRLTVAVQLQVAPSSQRLVGGLQSGVILVDYQRTQLNKIGTISAPANAHPLSELVRAGGGANPLSAVTGGQASGGGQPQAGSTPTPTQNGSTAPASPAAGTAAPKAYLDCLSAAQGDIAKIQACAPLLNR